MMPIEHTSRGSEATCDCGVSKHCLKEVIANLETGVDLENWCFFGKGVETWAICPFCAKTICRVVEDRYDAKMIDESIKEQELSGEDMITLEKLKKDLNLKSNVTEPEEGVTHVAGDPPEAVKEWEERQKERAKFEKALVEVNRKYGGAFKRLADSDPSYEGAPQAIVDYLLTMLIQRMGKVEMQVTALERAGSQVDPSNMLIGPGPDDYGGMGEA